MVEKNNEERILSLLYKADDITGPDHFMCNDGTEVIVSFKDTETAQAFTELLKSFYINEGLELRWIRFRRVIAHFYYRTAMEIFNTTEERATEIKNDVLTWEKSLVDWGFHDSPFYVVGELLGHTTEELNNNKILWNTYVNTVQNDISTTIV